MQLQRVRDTGAATFGVLLNDEGVPFAVTLEEPWRENQHKISCIPSGVYVCKRFHSAKHPNTFEVTNVPGRDAILLHVGNTDADTEGCILVGEAFNKVNGKAGITQSKDGFAEFLSLNEGRDEFTLIVTDPA